MTSKLHQVAELVPATWMAKLDLVRPSTRSYVNGPFNGQRRRREIVREIATAVRFDRVIETGTFRGTTTEFLSAVFGVPISTVEANLRYYSYSRDRLAFDTDIEVLHCDSRQGLKSLAARPQTKEQTVFIYLDAHWERDLPLVDEVEIVVATWPNCVIMVDDFEVPGDAGYTFDDYGPGKRLSLEYLPVEALSGWGIYGPRAPSSQETGAKRGCCVIVSPSLTAVMADLSTLKSTV